MERRPKLAAGDGNEIRFDWKSRNEGGRRASI
jgi:hypothetical protein